MNAGIDYGLGKSNIDLETGIRYGVILIQSLDDYIYDDLEADYGEPRCPKCGNLVKESADAPENYANNRDYYCEDCVRTFWSEECYPEEPLGCTLTCAEYEATDAFNGACLFLTRSIYYTYCKFCSPCAPGAGDLNNPIADGVKTYCFGHEMFPEGKAPYAVYSVETNELVNPDED